MEDVLDPGAVILERIAAREVERARLEAATAADMLEFADLRRARAERHTDPRVRDLEASFAADELSVALHQAPKVVQDRLAQSRRVRGLMPNTWDAYLAGRIDAYRVSLIAAAVAKLRDSGARVELDRQIAAYASSHTPAQLRGKLKRFIAAHAPDGAAVKAERDKRSVWLNHQDDGMTYLTAYISTADAVRIDALLSQRAKAAAAGDGRTFDQRRADEFVAQLLGQVDGSTISSRAVIGVLVPVTTLAGLGDAPGTSFDGSYAMPADTVRDLTRQPGSLFYRIFTDPLGRILDITELGRFPSAKLATAIDIRDGTCRFPTCTRPAIDCDDDHRIPHPRGPTAGWNLRSLCRRHHNIKTHRIAEPTDYAMRPRQGNGSRAEADLAHFMVHMGYAA